MIFQGINRSDPDQVFVIAYNVAGATITGGYAAVWDTATFDGVRIMQPTTATFALFAGLASNDIADSAYGTLQVYGYKQSGFVTNDTSVAIAAGDLLVPVTAQYRLVRNAAGNGTVVGGALVIAGQAFATATTPAAAMKNVFIRAL
jgi:hypothetical protein